GHGERSNQQQCRSPSMHPLIVAPAGLRGEVGFTPPRIRRLPPSIVARLIRTVVGMTTELLPPPVIAPAHTRPAARAVAASKRYGKGDTAVTALDNVTVDIPAGRFTAVMGPSGSGKSTLMHCLAGLDTLTSGSVFLGDVELGKLNDRQLTKVRR